MTTRAEQQEALQARRNALVGKRNSIIFYAGWYAIDNASGRCKYAKSMGQALDMAEAANS